MMKTVATAAVVALVLTCSNLHAQEEVPATSAPDPAAPPLATAPASVLDSTPTAEQEKEKKGKKYKREDDDDREGKGKGKGGGKEKHRREGHEKKRGLERADEAAGEHGKKGRENAGAAASTAGSSAGSFPALQDGRFFYGPAGFLCAMNPPHG